MWEIVASRNVLIVSGIRVLIYNVDVAYEGVVGGSLLVRDQGEDFEKCLNDIRRYAFIAIGVQQTPRISRKVRTLVDLVLQ